MQKPTIFFSHSSQDRHALVKLKDLFIAKTGGSIEVFLSSDGQSIPFGRNWVHSVEQALNQAKLMLAFVTSNSLRSNWMYFETGHAYSKGVQVVPVGLGVDLSTVGAPLSLLQGFNVKSEAGFNNIIAVANEVFSHSHAETFSFDDFRQIANSTGLPSNGTLGPHAAAIEQIIISIKKADLGGVNPSQALQTIAELLAAEKVEHTQSEKSIRAQGMVLQAREGNGPDEIRLELDPAVVDTAFPLIERLVLAVHPAGMIGISMLLEFIELVDAVEQHHKLTGRLFGAGIRLAGDQDLEFNSLSFRIGRFFGFSGRSVQRGAAYLSIASQKQSLPLAEVRELLDLLFERRALTFPDK